MRDVVSAVQIAIGVLLLLGAIVVPNEAPFMRIVAGIVGLTSIVLGWRNRD